MKFFASTSLFNEHLTEIRTVHGDLIGFIEELAHDNFEATNCWKNVHQFYRFEAAATFLKTSYGSNPAVETRVLTHQGQLFLTENN